MPTDPHHDRPDRHRTTHRRPLARALAVGFVACLALAGCYTGQRPELEAVTEVDDSAANVVLERLERAGSVPFTATYDVIPTTTGEATVATVRQLENQRRVTIGDVDYLEDAGSSQTCQRASGECVDFLNDALISNLNITHRFWSDGIASRLKIDAARRVGFSVGHTETIAGRPAACADVPVLGGDVVYCALDAGVLARYFNADVTIELTSFSNDVDPASFATAADPGI
jgi:hypothetical protein